MISMSIIMGHRHTEQGFTIVEVVVTLSILALFLALFFTMYMTSMSQSKSTVTKAAADDIAQTNLRKISSKTTIPSTTNACDGTTSGSGNENNATLNTALLPDAATNTDPMAGSEVTMVAYTATPPANTIVAEPLTDTGLPATTTQRLLVMYPRGCYSSMPAKIISIVVYGPTDSDQVVHEAYVN